MTLDLSTVAPGIYRIDPNESPNVLELIPAPGVRPVWRPIRSRAEHSILPA